MDSTPWAKCNFTVQNFVYSGKKKNEKKGKFINKNNNWPFSIAVGNPFKVYSMYTTELNREEKKNGRKKNRGGNSSDN